MGKRHRVHLSNDTETAHEARSRKGRPVILKVGARKMHRDGNRSLLSASGVWLIDSAPPEYPADGAQNGQLGRLLCRQALAEGVRRPSPCPRLTGQIPSILFVTFVAFCSRLNCAGPDVPRSV
jgi:hypothetical protein